MAIIYQTPTMCQAHTGLFKYSILFNQPPAPKSRNFYYLHLTGKGTEARGRSRKTLLKVS